MPGNNEDISTSFFQSLILFFFIFIFFLTEGVIRPEDVPVQTTHCQHYNHTLCDKDGFQGCSGIETCPKWQEPDKKNHCFVLWTNSSEGRVSNMDVSCYFLRIMKFSNMQI